MATPEVKSAHEHHYDQPDPDLVHKTSPELGALSVSVLHGVINRCSCGMAKCSVCKKEFRPL